ncbi:Hsp20/alpha crystallin family protein, partial [Acinetobacter baumannii]
HKNQEEKNNGRFESFSESFEQSVHLPCKVNADKVQASVKDGILTVTLPKS